VLVGARIVYTLAYRDSDFFTFWLAGYMNWTAQKPYVPASWALLGPRRYKRSLLRRGEIFRAAGLPGSHPKHQALSKPQCGASASIIPVISVVGRISPASARRIQAGPTRYQVILAPSRL
jgi:hypothetical protein